MLAERVTVDARAHAERITPNVLAALADAGLTMADLDAVVVGCGPGPFTGLRVGMATAAAYGHALGIPVYGVCSLDAIGGQTTGETLVVTDARRREVYWARYRDGVRIDGPAVSAPADVDPGTARSVAGSPDHAALFGLPVLRAAVPDTGRVWWPRWPTGPQRPRRWCRCICVGRTPRRSPSGRRLPMTVDRTIGALTVADADRCAELEALLFPGDDPWPTAAFVRELAAKHNHYVAARAIGDTLIGYGGISRLGRTPPFEYEVHTIGVDPAYQGRGIGRRLLDELLNFAAGAVVHLEVRTDNATAIALYRSVGFTEVGLRRRLLPESAAPTRYTMRARQWGHSRLRR